MEREVAKRESVAGAGATFSGRGGGDITRAAGAFGGFNTQPISEPSGRCFQSSEEWKDRFPLQLL